MAFNKQYNTRNSGGRYNTPGQFVPASEQMSPMQQPQFNVAVGQQRKPPVPNQNLQPIQSADVDMKPSVESLNSALTNQDSGDNTQHPHWMKSKLSGVKKISNKERRRRQNENLRRLLTPKNALMVLNEMLPNEQLANQFHVEPAPPECQAYNKPSTSFCADLTIDGNLYKGYGENKLTARNVAAEQAIRDIIIQKLKKVNSTDDKANMAVVAEGEAEGEDEEALPMIQLASFALHKLFSEWEYEGHKVPQLKPLPANSTSEGEAPRELAPRAPPAPRKKELPTGAADMHPCMLLTFMRPHLKYRELDATGDRPQNMLFTLAVDVDGETYLGKASNKKEARRQAAMAACAALFGVRYPAPPQPPPQPMQPAL